MDYLEARKIENENFREAIRRWPRFFESQTFIDDSKTLEKYGIYIPKKKGFPLGYLKLWPQDFIVEEINTQGEIQTVSPEKFLSTKKDFDWQDPIIYADLVKCGLSTIEVAEELTKRLNLAPKDIKYAGIKDKHAITSQLISIKNGDIEKLHQIASPNFFIKNVFSGEREIYLGGLKGNQFTILIRTGPNFDKNEFLKRSKEVEKEGFFNFFYLQRFGVPRLTNPHSGLSILKGDYEKALFTAICKPGERELVYFQSLRKEIEQLWGKWDKIEEVLELFPLTFQNERTLMSHLIKNPDDFIGALNQIPRVVQLWLTSLAALLFNKAISSCLQKEEKPPATFPLILTPDEKTWAFYKDLLNKIGIFSITFAQKNLKPFPFIVLRKREQNTMEKVKIISQKIIPGGVILNFALSKGCYATTFLSHLFNLASGNLPKKFSNLPIDTKANLNQPSLEEILNKFTDVVSSPSWRYLWRIY